ncbi:MAG: preprotein translocase subunit SecA [Myxococcota bacterium]|nr:preprotein translocase subunit SecA [Myxococcota bacterium]
MQRMLSKVFGSTNERELKRLGPLAERINGLESAHEPLSDEVLRGKTGEFRERLERGEELDGLLPEAFALVREVSKRTLGQRHYDVQLIGGIFLHQGNIAEMKTGEGKTLVATLPSYLNALSGRGVHIVTVNDYLAARDAEWMGQIHRFLGLSVGVIQHGLDDAQRAAAYRSDITYATNNELGFDYLRDNMKRDAADQVQRELSYAIVDEVDSILVDEARTPLIISGASESNTQIYQVANRVIPSLKEGDKGDPKEGIPETGDYHLDLKTHSATFSEAGIKKVEKVLNVANLYDPEMMPVLHAVSQALAAHTLKKRDVDYIVAKSEDSRGREVVIIDEHTGRQMRGRRWSDGLHQAVEAKEGIAIQSESQTYASITFQNYFRMYDKLAGMTGTADTEAPEFAKIYDLDVRIVPTNRPMVRADMGDVVYKTKREKQYAVVDEIRERQISGQPVLVGTISIESSEQLSKLLKKKGIKHNVLNAKHHEREAEVVAQAGRKGALTISTNMAGRGTDIVLGGNSEMMALQACRHRRDHPEFEAELAKFETQCGAEREEVLAAGGLHILATERHESRRIDNQLRGRSGRQGDPGSSQFFLSLEDDLLQIFEADRVKQWWDRVGVEEGEAIENRLLTRVIENAQSKVEARNFDIRKHLLEYDDVMNKQRQAFYARRSQALVGSGLSDEVRAMVEGVLVALLDIHWPEKGSPDEEALADLAGGIRDVYGVPVDPTAPPFVEDGAPARDRNELGRAVLDQLNAVIDAKCERWNEIAERNGEIGFPSYDFMEREIVLGILDQQWKDHLHSMDGLREGIGLRGYAQVDPKREYAREGFALFGEMEERIDQHIANSLFHLEPRDPQAEEARPRVVGRHPALAQEPPEAHGGAAARRGPAGAGKAGVAAGKVGRNDPCPCGSGKKFKKCCGS